MFATVHVHATGSSLLGLFLFTSCMYNLRFDTIFPLSVSELRFVNQSISQSINLSCQSLRMLAILVRLVTRIPAFVRISSVNNDIMTVNPVPSVGQPRPVSRAWFSPSSMRCLRPCTPPVRLFSVYSLHVQPSIRHHSAFGGIWIWLIGWASGDVKVNQRLSLSRGGGWCKGPVGGEEMQIGLMGSRPACAALAKTAVGVGGGEHYSALARVRHRTHHPLPLVRPFRLPHGCAP
eukprot:scaffold8248_cov118-Isochrysis_galbana.AAC.4